MPCYWPRTVWRRPGLAPVFREPLDATGYVPLRLPCGGCIGCRVRNARDWTIRCLLELHEHEVASWATLTYDPKYLPPTLHKPHLSGFLKRLRARVYPNTVRFFGTGEYGDIRARPHYHVVLYGVRQDNAHIRGAWPYGLVDVQPVTPRNIAYTAGYAQKKIRQSTCYRPQEAVDSETGEVYTPQPPFRLASRRPGIGGNARRFVRSWRSSAVHMGREVPVPRFLHAAWKEVATPLELEALEAEHAAIPWSTKYEREAGEAIALVKYQRQTQRRSL